MFTNPGAVPRHAQPLIRASESGIPETICGRCDAYKPPRSHHCRICNRCIVRMDHHCPWMNNCIGANNQKHFMLFLLYTLVEAVYALALVLNNVRAGETYPRPRRNHLLSASAEYPRRGRGASFTECPRRGRGAAAIRRSLS